jgi:hypothetical protein
MMSRPNQKPGPRGRLLNWCMLESRLTPADFTVSTPFDWSPADPEYEQSLRFALDNSDVYDNIYFSASAFTALLR